MENMIFYAWLVYAAASLAIILGTWKFLGFMPLLCKLGVFFSQLLFLAIPAQQEAGNWAPAFIVLVVDVLSRQPKAELVATGLPLTLALIAAWPLAFIVNWLASKLWRPEIETAATAEETEEAA